MGLITEIRLNPLVRLFLYPVGKKRRKKELDEYQNSSEPDKIKKFKNIHVGKRCFLIGNGPSLSVGDLGLIKDEICFASNKIYALFDKTEWRPTYYVAIDRDIIQRNVDEIRKLECSNKFIDFSMKEKCGKAVYICANPTFEISLYGQKKAYIKEEVSEFFSNGASVTFTMVQLALYMGFKEIYLLGNDFSMPYYKDKYGIPHRTDEKAAHFKNGDSTKKTYLFKEAGLYAFQQAREYCDEHGIIIKNATRGGKLEVFERVKFEDLVKEKRL